MTMNDSRFLALPWMHKSSKQQSNLQLLSTEKLTNVDESTTKLGGHGIGSAWGTGPAVLNMSSMLEILMYFALVFIL